MAPLLSGELISASSMDSLSLSLSLSGGELALFSGETVAAATGVPQPASSMAPLLSGELISARKDAAKLRALSSCLLSESISSSRAASASLSDLICSLSSASTPEEAGSASCTWEEAGSATGASVLRTGEVDGICCFCCFCSCCCCSCLFFLFRLFLLAAVAVVSTATATSDVVAVLASTFASQASCGVGQEATRAGRLVSATTAATTGFFQGQYFAPSKKAPKVTGTRAGFAPAWAAFCPPLFFLADESPASVLPTSVLPASVLPASVLPTSVLPAGFSPAAFLPAGFLLAGFAPACDTVFPPLCFLPDWTVVQPLPSDLLGGWWTFTFTSGTSPCLATTSDEATSLARTANGFIEAIMVLCCA